MDEKDKILEHLEETVLKTEVGSRESIEAHRAYTDYLGVLREKKRDENDLRLKQNAHDDELVRARDQAMIDDARFKHERLMDWMDKGVKIAALVVGTVVTIWGIKEDKDGKPLFGTAKDLFSSWFKKTI